MTSSKFENVWKVLKENNFYLDKELSDDVICTICKKIMINVCSSSCGCRYCLECIKFYLNGSDKLCPGYLEDCKNELINFDSNVHIDNATNFKISKLVLKCPGQYCEFKDQLRNLHDHMRVCNAKSVICPFVNIGCRNDDIAYDKMDDHLKYENQSHSKLLMECIDNFRNEIESLTKRVADIKQENNHFKEEIIELKSDNENIKISNLDLHNKIENQTKDILDLNRDIVSLKNVNRRLQNEMEDIKVDKESDTCQKTKDNNENNNVAVKYNAAIIEQLNKVNVQIEKTEMANLQINNEFELQAREMIQLKQQLKLSDKKVIECQSESKHKNRELMLAIEEVSGKTCELSMNLQLKEEKIINMELRIDTIETYRNRENEFIWNIKDFSDKLKQARNGINQMIYSDSFFAYKNGYMGRLIAYPNGIKDAKGTYLSLLFNITCGPYDNVLTWPIKHNLTLSIINQQTGNVHKFDETLNLSWNKPVRDDTGGMGSIKFVKLNELLTNVALCQGDQIFIKCTLKQMK